MSEELRKAAEKLLDRYVKLVNSEDDLEVAALRQALAATEQSEPVAWMLTSPNGTVTLFENDEEGEDAFKGWFGGSVQPLYTHPPKHEPLSDEDILSSTRFLQQLLDLDAWCTHLTNEARDECYEIKEKLLAKLNGRK